MPFQLTSPIARTRLGGCSGLTQQVPRLEPYPHRAPIGHLVGRKEGADAAPAPA
jgi:hypothetical protein